MISKEFSSIHNRIIVLSSLMVLLSLQGCGSDEEGPARAAVSGVVNLDGQPLEKGVIRFIPEGETAGPQATLSILSGKFEVDEKFGPVVGQHRVEISSTDDGGYPMDDERAIQELRKAGIKKIEVVKVPAIYNQRSTLQETVTDSGPNEFQFDLSSKN